MASTSLLNCSNVNSTDNSCKTPCNLQTYEEKDKFESSELLLEKPNVILNYFVTGKINVPILLSLQCSNPQRLMMGLKVISKACTCTDEASLVANLVSHLMASKSIFITAVSLVIRSKLCATPLIKDDFLNDILELLTILVQKIPTASSDILKVLMPQLHEISKRTDQQGQTFKKLQELEKQEEVLDEFIQKPKVLNNSDVPINFRFLPVIPSTQEILSRKKLFLHPAIIKGPYENVEQYLDIQYKLMREDMFRDFRKCVLDYKCFRDFTNGSVYHNVHFERITLDIEGKIFYFSVPMNSIVNWKATKHLIPGSLICISENGFESFQFATIRFREPNDNWGNICYIGVCFESEDIENLFSFCDIIEAGGYFESYKHIFKNFKHLCDSNFPLKKCLINFEGCNEAPFVLSDKQELALEKFKDKIIRDQDQAGALDLAVRNRVSLIQGPPGTGKSYLGIQIARYLLNFASKRKPLILICYTNHALDQFLEAMLRFTPKVIRIGGRSESEELEPHNLNNITRSVNSFLQGFRKEFKESKIVSNVVLISLIDKISYANCEGKLKTVEDILEVVENYDSAYGRGFENLYKKSKAYFAVALQSLRIACLFGKLDMDRHLNKCYAVAKSNCKSLTQCFENFVNDMSYPFRGNTMDVMLADLYRIDKLFADKNLQENVLFKVLHSSSHIKVHHWLMTDPLFSQVYDEIIEFQVIVIEELLHYFQVKKITNMKKKHSHLVNLQPLSELLLRLCTNSVGYDLIRKKNINYEKIKLFVQTYLNQNADVFKLLLNSANRWANQKGVVVNAKSENLWLLDLPERWKLLNLWIETIYLKCNADMALLNPFNFKTEDFNFCESIDELNSLQCSRNANFLREADIIGLTTTGAAKQLELLKCIKPTTYIIEEAAEVFESHVIASLAPTTEHLILIGDHVQLRPSPTVYDLSVKYHLDVSMFERLFENSVPSKCLSVQHRMRPDIAQLLVPEFYDVLENHSSVTAFDNVAGISSDVFFLQHTELENEVSELKSHSNDHEASFVVALAKYLITQGHKSSSITILTTYVGQLHLIRKYREKINVDVLTTTVDNYQGEENDIILISFVRSNKEYKTGFISTDNRICVALSRARKGLYCIGNFNMFASRSEIWKSLLVKLKKMNSIGEKMQIHCCRHPGKNFFIKNTNDILYFTKTGCRNPCVYTFPCGHECCLGCHGEELQHKEGRLCDSKCIESVKKIQNFSTLNEKQHFSDCEIEVEKQVIPDSGELQSKLNSDSRSMQSNQIEIFEDDSKTESKLCISKNCNSDPNINTIETQPVEEAIQVDAPFSTLVQTKTNFDNPICSHLTSVQMNSTEAGLDIKDETKLLFTSNVTDVNIESNLSSCLPISMQISSKTDLNKDTDSNDKSKTDLLSKCNSNLPIRDFETYSHENTKLLPCGHLHPTHTHFSGESNEVKCREIVTSSMKCGKTINHICGEEVNHECLSPLLLECGHLVPCNMVANSYICSENIRKTFPCGHCVLLPCYKTECEDICMSQIEVALPCCHTAVIPCCKKDCLDSICCKEMCVYQLQCGHKCSGICYNCQISKVHEVCRFPIEKLLPCGHVLKTTCNSPFVSCCERCRYCCDHSRCINPCYSDCFFCNKPCTWICDHIRCDNLCGEICDRPPCDHPCTKRYQPCNHQCPCYCGEACPESCVHCDGLAIVTNVSRLVLLEDCGHLIPCDELTIFLLQNSPETFPQCPTCQVPITKNKRFGNLVKMYYKSQLKLSDFMIGFEMMRFFKPFVPFLKFKEHTENLWNKFDMRNVKASEYFFNLKLIRCLNVLFCLYQLPEARENIKLLYNLLLDKQDVSNIGPWIFKNGALLFIELVVAEKGMFSKIGRINEICEDVELILKQPRFNVETIEEVLKTVNSIQNVDCLTFSTFCHFLEDLHREIT